MFYSPRLKKVMDDSETQAYQRRSEFVGTEHVLMALMFETGGIAHEALLMLGVTGASLMATIDKLAPPPPPPKCSACGGTGTMAQH